jgi:hypothetical protein
MIARVRKFQDGRYFVENQHVREAELERNAERYAAEHDGLPRTRRFAWIRGLLTRRRPASGPRSRTRPR